MSTANLAWLNTLNMVYDHGQNTDPRGIFTKELMNQSFEIDMRFPIVNIPRRKIHYTFMAAEAYWITSGMSLVEEIAPYNRHISKFSDDGFIFNGAYGPMFANQLEYVVNTLLKDNFSRQAVMTRWHPNPRLSKDIKCTVSLCFYIRQGMLNCTVMMRSNDLWLGRPYDIFNFSMMALKVLTRLNECYEFNKLNLGNLHYNTVSSHIYEQDFDKAKDVIDNGLDLSTAWQLPESWENNWSLVTDHLLGVMHEDRNMQDWS
jgi:thymidylate synthase